MKYLVVEEYWEYNDEYFTNMQGDAYSIASKLFDDKEEAQELAKKLNEEMENNDSDYYVDYNDQVIQPFRVVSIEE